MSQISNDKLMEVLMKVSADVGEIKGQVTSLNGLEPRIRKVERWQHFYSGAGAIVGAILGAVGVHITKSS